MSIHDQERGWNKDYERRVKYVYIGEEHLIAACVAYMTNAETPKFRYVLKNNPFPVDCDVVRVCHDWQRRAFGVLLYHPSFDPVPVGGVPPNLDERGTWEWVAVERDDVPLVVEPAVVNNETK